MPRPTVIVSLVAAALLVAGTPGCGDARVAPAAPRPAATTALPADLRGPTYRMDVRLATDHRTLDATATIHWENTSTAAVQDLWWHLYLNAFANAETLFMRTGGRSGHRGHEPGAYGHVELRELRLTSGEDLLRGSSHDPTVPYDSSQLHTPLPRAIAPGESVDLVLAFRAVLPAAFARTGYWRDLTFAGQWFPKLAVLEPNGRWAHFAYHFNSEFYADFGAYDVTLHVPHGDVVGATGELAAPVVTSPAGDTHRYTATAVHDFAWTAWRGYRERAEAIDGVRVRVLFPPGLAGVAGRDLAALRAAMPSYRRRYGTYPYPGLTVVVPPPEAAGVEGMEYPTLITTAGYWFMPRGVHDAEYVTIHEFAHQYFYGLLASNESAAPFLDEGLAEYSTGVCLGEMFPPGEELAGTFWGNLGYWAYQGGFSSDLAPSLSVARTAAEYPSSLSYGGHVYRRTAAIFRTASQTYGSEAVARALRVYADRWRFRHPTPDDLLAAFADTLGPEMVERFLRPALFGDAALDYAVRSVERTPAPPSAAGPRYAGRVVLRHRGALAVPMDVEFEDTAGRRSRVRWDGREADTVLSYAGAAPLRAVRLDPDERVPLDTDRLNNARAVPGAAGSALPLTTRLAFWLGAALRAVGP